MITPPPLLTVSPGDPITAESWNSVLAAIGLLVDDANTQRGTLTVKVRNAADGNPIRSAAVTAQPDGEPARPSRAGVFAGGDVKAHLIEQLLPGAYALVVEADGFATEKRPITLDETGDALSVQVDMNVVEARSTVPSLLGVALTQALTTLTQAGFTAGRVIDSHGEDIPPGAVPADIQPLPVLNQSPEPGALVPKTVPVFVHVAARAEALKKVAVPDIRGLSVMSAKAKLEAAGLTLGSTSTVTS